MKKYDFLPTTPPFLQDFCKKAQWRAKKLRERGSNTARQTGNGGGGSPDCRASCRFRRADTHATPMRHPCDTMPTPMRHHADTHATPMRHPCDTHATPMRHHADTHATPMRHQRQGANTKKSPIPQSGNRASAIERRRALLTFL